MLEQNFIGYLSLITVDDHSHAFQIDSLLDNSVKAGFEFLVEGVQVLCWYGSDVNAQILESGSVFFAEIDVRAVGMIC